MSRCNHWCIQHDASTAARFMRTQSPPLSDSFHTVQVAGFVGLGFPEYLVKALRHRFDSTQHPQNLHVYAVAACGDGKGRGLDELAVDGLVSTATFGWAGLSPKLLKMIAAKKINAWNLPLGVGELLCNAVVEIILNICWLSTDCYPADSMQDEEMHFIRQCVRYVLLAGMAVVRMYQDFHLSCSVTHLERYSSWQEWPCHPYWAWNLC